MTKVNQNAKKGPLSHQKIKCSFLDYVQLLMIGWVILVMKVNQNAKKAPWFIKKLILIFGLHSTSDDWLSNLSDKSQPKCKKGPLSHQKMKCSFLDYVQLLMIGRVIWVTKVNCNANKGLLSHQKINSHFWITFNFWWSAEQSEWQKSTTMQKRPSKSSKNEMLIFDYVQLLMIGRVIWVMKVNQNAK